MIETKDTKWSIGTIVALQTHFYDSDNESEIAVIAGDPKLISPLMIIIETIAEKNAYSEKTGMKLSDESNFQCLCKWFSHKTYQFEEGWISSRLLKTISENNSTNDALKFDFGDIVEFKTSMTELGKKKSSYKQTQKNISNTITPELNFFGPTLQVIGTVKYEIKEPLKDPNTLKTRKRVPMMLIKCKYFNQLSDKFTEVLLPEETLRKIVQPSKEILDIIKDSIHKDKYLILELPLNRAEENPKVIPVKPNKVSCKAGRFYLECYNYFGSKMEEYDISSLEGVVSKSEIFSEKLPRFKLDGSIVKLTHITADTIRQLISDNSKKVWLTYVDDEERKTERCIIMPEVMEGEEIAGKKPHYLKGYCLLRQAERYFRVERIKEICLLDI